MNISCSICAELFRGPDAHNLNVTRCGHVFHNECLAKWLERKNTCPECRSKTTTSTVIRLFVNIADSSYLEEEDGPRDLVGLQSENDNLKFRIIEKDGAIKSKEESLANLREENKKLVTGQTQSRNVILALEQKLEQNKIITAAHVDQLKAMRTRLTEIDHLREKLKEANEKNKTAEMVQHLITGSQEETEELLREGRTSTELATMVTTLKRELRNCNAKRTQVRNNAEVLAKQLKLCKDEKSKLEEKYQILESKVFQLENNSENKNDSLNKSGSADDSESPVVEVPAKRTFGEHLTFHKKVSKLDSARNVSPSTYIKASSIAGLSPLLKRTHSAESYKLSPVDNDKPESFSILKKPRLIQHRAKKLELRPSRLISAVTSLEKPSTSDEPAITAPVLSVPRFADINNRFRLGQLSRPK